MMREGHLDGAWLRRVRFVVVSPETLYSRCCQAISPLILVFEFGQPPLCPAMKAYL